MGVNALPLVIGTALVDVVYLSSEYDFFLTTVRGLY